MYLCLRLTGSTLPQFWVKLLSKCQIAWLQMRQQVTWPGIWMQAVTAPAVKGLTDGSEPDWGAVGTLPAVCPASNYLWKRLLNLMEKLD